MPFVPFTDEAVLQRPHPEDATGGAEGTASAGTREGLFQMRTFLSDRGLSLQTQRTPQGGLGENGDRPNAGRPADSAAPVSRYLSQTGL